MTSEPLQPALFEPDEDDALLLPVELIQKRVTGKQAEQLEWKRNAILMLLASDWPIESISKAVGVNKRTVMALAAKHGEEVARRGEELAQVFLRTGARWLALARGREHEASFAQLIVASGIATDKAQLLAGMGQMSESGALKEEQDHVEAARALRILMDAEQAGDQADGGRAPAPEAHSTDNPRNPQGNDTLAGRGVAGGGAGEAPPGCATPAAHPLDAHGPGRAGGGSEAPGPREGPTHPHDGDLHPRVGPPQGANERTDG
jgi:hypothetical protein